ncbi:MAG TPA: DNA lyase [Methanoculleus sp.]|nr:DNA lyase [Methanoculleus sp.]
MSEHVVPEADFPPSLSRRYYLSPDQPFDLDPTLSCGQVFRWHRADGIWYGIIENEPVAVRQSGSLLTFSGCSEASLVRYFALDIDLGSVLVTAGYDQYLEAAVRRHGGLRIVRQEPWECLVSYLCAQNTSIPHIQRMLGNLCARAGDEVCGPAGRGYAFPEAGAVASLPQEEKRACALGYRAGYIHRTAEAVAGDPDWVERIRQMDYEDARHEMMRFPGAGPKVADCILLFGFEMYEAFPVDVWVRAIMKTCYGVGSAAKTLSPKEYEVIRRFGRDHFGPYAGYAQEYLFADRQHLTRLNGNE